MMQKFLMRSGGVACGSRAVRAMGDTGELPQDSRQRGDSPGFGPFLSSHDPDQGTDRRHPAPPGARTRTGSGVEILSMPVSASGRLCGFGCTRARFTESTWLVDFTLMGRGYGAATANDGPKSPLPASMGTSSLSGSTVAAPRENSSGWVPGCPKNP